MSVLNKFQHWFPSNLQPVIISDFMENYCFIPDQKARRCDSYLQSETIDDWPTDPLQGGAIASKSTLGILTRVGVRRVQSMGKEEEADLSLARIWGKRLKLIFDAAPLAAFDWPANPRPLAVSSIVLIGSLQKKQRDYLGIHPTFYTKVALRNTNIFTKSPNFF